MTNKSLDQIQYKNNIISLKDFLVLYHDRTGIAEDLVYKIHFDKLAALLGSGSLTGGYIDIGTSQLVLTTTTGNVEIDISPILQTIQVIGSFVNVTEFTLIHNFGRFARTTLLDSAGKEQKGFNLYHTTNQVTFKSNIPFSGTLVCH